jgi:GntR family transcriptional regulator
MDRDENEGLPKYQLLAKLLAKRIDDHEFEAGEKIPSEGELCDEYGVSRVTVRQAVGALTRRGLLKREQGKGTYVLPQRLRRDISRIYSFTTDMIALGMEPSSEVLELAERTADEDTAAALELKEPGATVTVVKRLRMANGSPLLLETTMVPSALCPGLVDMDLAKGSLYQILQKEYRLTPKSAIETYESIVLPAATARLLRCPTERNQPGLAIRRIARLEEGTPLELTVSVGRGDRFTLTIDMTSDVAGFRRSFDV